MINRLKTYVHNVRQNIRKALQINLHKTLYVNFRLFPYKTASKFPVIIYGKCKVCLGTNSKIVFNVPVKTGLIKIGHQYELITYNTPSSFKLYGTFIVNGEIQFGTSVSIFVDGNGVLTMGNFSSLGSKGILICVKKVTFSEYTRIGSESSISDSNYHFMKDTESGIINAFLREIRLGRHNYIGSRVAILPGTITPDNITIGFGSVCNKDYTKAIPENSIIAGMPAKLLKSNVVRLFGHEEEMAFKYFHEHPDQTHFVIS